MIDFPLQPAKTVVRTLKKRTIIPAPPKLPVLVDLPISARLGYALLIDCPLEALLLHSLLFHAILNVFVVVLVRRKCGCEASDREDGRGGERDNFFHISSGCEKFDGPIVAAFKRCTVFG